MERSKIFEFEAGCSDGSEDEIEDTPNTQDKQFIASENDREREDDCMDVLLSEMSQWSDMIEHEDMECEKVVEETSVERFPEPEYDEEADDGKTRVRRFHLVLNNYTSTEVEAFKTRFPGFTKYCIFGKEVGDNGTPHLQCYIETSNKCSINGLQKKISTAQGFRSRYAIKVCRGSAEQNIAYCSKDGDTWWAGTVPKGMMSDDWHALATYGLLKCRTRKSNGFGVCTRRHYCWEKYNRGSKGKSECIHKILQWYSEVLRCYEKYTTRRNVAYQRVLGLRPDRIWEEPLGEPNRRKQRLF